MDYPIYYITGRENVKDLDMGHHDELLACKKIFKTAEERAAFIEGMAAMSEGRELENYAILTEKEYIHLNGEDLV